jgi:hypothetical protein
MIKTRGGPIEINAVICVTTSDWLKLIIYVDGIQIVESQSLSASGSGGRSIPVYCVVPVSAGTHKVDIYWYVNGTAYAYIDANSHRNFTVKEL